MTDLPHHMLPFSPERFTDVLDRCQRPLYIFVYGMLGEEEQTRDLMQDTFCTAWRVAQQGLPPFDGASDESGMRRWLFHIAYNQTISALRRRRLIQWLPLEIVTLTLSFEDQVAEGQAVRTALAALTPFDSACLLLVIVQGFTVAEASQIIGSTSQAAARRFTRAKERLRKAYLAQNPQPVQSEMKVRS